MRALTTKIKPSTDPLKMALTQAIQGCQLHTE